MQHAPVPSHEALGKGGIENGQVNAGAFTKQTANAPTVCEFRVHLSPGDIRTGQILGLEAI